MELTIDLLMREAQQFSQIISSEDHPELLGVTDGKAVGTYVETAFRTT